MTFSKLSFLSIRNTLYLFLYQRQHGQALSVVFKKISVEKKRFEFFCFWSNFELISKIVSKCNSLFELNSSRENLVLLK